jgi:hypothetical protein
VRAVEARALVSLLWRSRVRSVARWPKEMLLYRGWVPYLVGKLLDTRGTIDQLAREAQARAQLHEESLREIDYQVSKAAFSLDQFSHWGIGYNTGVDFKRNHLEREISNLRKERRSTLVRTWEDIASLRKEFREAVAEYKSLLSRLGLL